MPVVKLMWTPLSEPQFDELKKRAIAAGQLETFVQTHNEILHALRDLTSALEKGEPLYKTRKPGGVVRHWVHDFLSVCYLLLPAEQVCWIINYNAVPESWPE